MTQYIVAAVGDWNRRFFDQWTPRLAGEWHFSDTPQTLQAILKSGIKPTYIFFPHWRWVVPKAITNNFECVCFHMTDVPYGRGGSPLQNLIVRGHKESVLTALQMDEGMDTGPVYFKVKLKLNGTAKEIYERCSLLSWDLISKIITQRPTPAAQIGDVVEFKRRNSRQSRLPEDIELSEIYDFIRMLDAPGYPNAFIESGGYRIEFNAAELKDNELIARAKFTYLEEK
jgi:methionyl-tRNA formyltransferase